jgi:4-aminobutyrate aminotransferase-like enzyme
MGLVLLARLRTFQQEYSEISDMRGLGLIIGTEFTSPQVHPWTGRVQAVTKAAMAEGLLLLTCGPWENTIRWIPPLIISELHIEEALEKFERALCASR